MSDGRTESMRGTYFSGKHEVKHSKEYYDANRNRGNKNPIPEIDPQTGELNPYYKELTGKNNPFDIKHMPNQKWHKIISFIKSGIRILGYAIIPFDLVIATGVLILSEVIGIVEELV